MTTTNSKKPLTLLGIWNILPVGSWTWFNDVAVKKLESLTGRKLGIFCYIKNDLQYECFVRRDTDLLKQDLDKLTPKKQLGYVQKITDDYYTEVKSLERQLESASSQNFFSLGNQELASHIDLVAMSWSRVTMQIWYAVLLDIWYPSPRDQVNLKSIIAKARDHCGHLHEQSDKIEHKMYSEAARRLGFSERELYFK